MTTAKEKKVLLELIDVYRQFPLLYDRNDENFTNNAMRHEAYETLLPIYKHISPDATIKGLKKKILNMRSSYVKEYKKVEASKQYESETENIYVPTLWYFEAFQFLGSTEETPQDTSVYEDSLLLSAEEIEIEMEEAPVPSKKRKKHTELIKESDIKKEADEVVRSKEEDWDILGRSIGHQLRDLDKRQLTISRKLISDVIYYATLNRLDEDSRIDVRSATTHGHHGIIHPSLSFHRFLDDASSSVSQQSQSQSPRSASSSHYESMKPSPQRSLSPYDLILSSPSP